MQIVWQKEYNVNVIEIDAQYHRLVDSFNDLVKLVKRGATDVEISDSVTTVEEQSMDCFNMEEQYFYKLGFNGEQHYRQGQSSCLRKLNLFKQYYDQKQPLINLAHVEGIAGALVGHVSTSHSEFNVYMKEHGLHRFMKAHG